jgi:large subunit ribosomal protein L29
MTVMRMEEIRDMSPEEMDEKIQELKSELLRERTMIASGGVPENPGNIKEIKRTIARLLTVKAEKAGENK